MTIRIPVHRPSLGREELNAVGRVFDSRWLGVGEATKEFESRLRELVGVKHAFAVNSGTAALHTALLTLGVGPGDEVVVPSMTFVSSAQVVLAVGARPVFCEVRSDTLTMDVGHVASLLTDRTKVIMPVHYGGRISDMEGLSRLIQDRRIGLVEDAAHAFGSTLEGRWAGTMGDVGCFSFDPIKNITCGDGGAIVTDDDEIGARIGPRINVGIGTDSWSRLTEGCPGFYSVASHGLRYGLSNINSCIGLEQLERFDWFRDRKRTIVARYDQALAGVEGLTVVRHDIDGVFPFNYIVRVSDKNRERLMAHLGRQGIGSIVHFIPCHLQPVFAAFRTSLPVTERLFDEILSLPLYCEMTAEDVEEVVSSVRSFFEGR